MTDADEYAELLKHMLDFHAPLRTGWRRSGQHDNRQLSDETRRAKQLRRRCERRCRRTGLETDRQAYLRLVQLHATAFLSHELTDQIRDEVFGDIGATWRTARRLLHNDYEVVYDDAECVQLDSTFCQFFVDKVNRIGNNISKALWSSASRVFAARPHCGPDRC